jgi:hypothetical protein
MPARLGPRFALEAGFLILLAVVAGLGDLSWLLIVLVMGAALVLAAIHEYARWKEGPRLPAPVRRLSGPAAPPVEAPPADDLTRVILREEPEPAPEPEAAAAALGRRLFRRASPEVRTIPGELEGES